MRCGCRFVELHNLYFKFALQNFHPSKLHFEGGFRYQVVEGSGWDGVRIQVGEMEVEMEVEMEIEMELGRDVGSYSIFVE